LLAAWCVTALDLIRFRFEGIILPVPRWADRLNTFRMNRFSWVQQLNLHLGMLYPLERVPTVTRIPLPAPANTQLCV
jgi:hypothetical protein